jgi:hypothetical protein
MEADISTLRKTGHFYFALTRRGGEEEAWLAKPWLARLSETDPLSCAGM